MESADYRLQMYTKNKLSGFLNAMERVKDGEEKIFYDISSKQNMSRMFERKEMGFDELKNMFYSWEKAVSEAERFLLNPSGILCSPDYIYYEVTSGCPEWIFYPGVNEELYPSGLTLLAEYLLEKVDHRDTRAVDIAYRFYRSAKEGRFLLPEMVKALDEALVQSKEYVPKEEPEIMTTEPDAIILDEEVVEKENDFLDMIGRFFRFGKTSRKENKSKRKKESVRTGADSIQRTANLPQWSKAEEDETECRRTRLLGEENGTIKRELKNIATKERYSLKNLPVVIGKLEGSVDICLDDDSVSRLHARFFEQDGEIFLEDLNSTNGCSVNEIPLENNEKVQISPGDRILIGETEFIFN